MAAKIIDGKQIAQQIRGELQKEIEELKRLTAAAPRSDARITLGAPTDSQKR